MKNSFFYLLLFMLLSLSLYTLFAGDTPWTLVWEGTKFRLQGSSQEWNPLLDERIPRLIVILCTGASLAVAGVVMQSLFQNPLASPSVLGITLGGNVLAILVLIFGLATHLPFALPGAAVTGCLLTLFLVYFLGQIQVDNPLNSLILIGVAVSTIFAAFHSLLLYAFRDQWQLIQTITEWEAGSTFDRQWQHVHMQLPLTLIGLGGCWIYREELNLMALGDEEAKNLGVDTNKVRWRLFLCVALLTGGALAAMGIIPFFGLILPHLMRTLQGSNHIRLIPACLLGGALSLMSLDVLLRFFSIRFLSIGNCSALIGALFFLIFFLRSQQKNHVNQETL
jgi:iron complex transport system permease protein